jgi:F0F1-type ATP synthase gamma subunit
MKQTAVEKFIKQLEEQGESWENVSIGRIQISIKVEDYLNLIKQAKEMEKEQIIKAYNEVSNHIGEQYYNEEFNK